MLSMFTRGIIVWYICFHALFFPTWCYDYRLCYDFKGYSVVTSIYGYTFQFQNFFSWVLKCVKILLSEPTDQVPAANRFCLFPFYYSLHAQVVSQTLSLITWVSLFFCSELVVLFLKFLLDKDPIKQLLDANQRFECDL